MNRARSAPLLAVAAIAAVVALAPRDARACGGFYADEVEVDPDQEIVVLMDRGIETYVFRPGFCGAARDFGVILPIPSALTANPALADAALFEQLDAMVKPETVEVCQPDEDEGGGWASGCGCSRAGDAAGSFATDINIVNRGRVGVFEYVLLQATTVTAFDDWLDQNGFPHGTGYQRLYQPYVDQSWYFVALKVSAGANAPPAGQKLCGSLGPIQLSFASTHPVVPARIAAVNATGGEPQRWRVYTIAEAQQMVRQDLANQMRDGMPQNFATQMQDGSGRFIATLFFSGALPSVESGSGLGKLLSGTSGAAKRLTAITVEFPASTAPMDDIAFEDDPNTRDFRSQLHKYKECGGCASGTGAVTDLMALAVALAYLGAARRRRWQSRAE